MNKSIAILGAGSWGTALAMQAARSGAEVLLWSRKSEIADSINSRRKNPLHLNNIILPPNIKASTELGDADAYKHILIAIPTQSIRQVLGSFNPDSGRSFIICSKGVEIESLKLMSEVVLEVLPLSQISVLSGPNFAREVAEGFPSVTSIASQNPQILDELTKIFNSANFNVHPSDDIIGLQICGATKNVIAIACGICLGSNFGENTRAAILTKGLLEIGQLIVALGGKYETILSPAGLGDLSLTCGSQTSRNMFYGINLATGKVRGDKLTEGFYAAKSISLLAKKHGLDLPLIEALARAIENPQSASLEIAGLFV